MKKISLAFAIAVSSVFALQTTALALSSVNTATINYSNDYSAEVILGNNQIHSDQTATNMIPNDVKIAVNANFFDSYYNAGSSIVYPSNVPTVYGALMSDGYVINASGANNSIAFTYDGDILMDRVSIETYMLINSKTKINSWGTNVLYTDPSAISILTDDFDYSFTVNSGAKVFTIVNNKITEVSSATTHTVANGTMKLVYNKTAVENAEKWEILPKVGDTAEYGHTISSLTSSTSNDSWENVQTLVSGGRMLVINGTDVSANGTFNASYDEEKQDNYSSYQRSYIYTKKDGSLSFETAVGSFSEIAAHLVSQGAVNAISVDGGASSMLYDNGVYKTNAGRKLASVLAIVPNNGGVAPTMPQIDNSGNQGGSTTTPSVPSVNEPSSWALASVTEAIDLNIIPSWLQSNYTSSITREEFCQLITQYIDATTSTNVDQLRTILGVNYDDFTFTDTDSYQVRSMAALGIVNGVGDGSFNPHGLLTREQAATILARLVDLIGKVETKTDVSFGDQAKISSWALDGVLEIASFKIMNGSTNGDFNPQDTFTREQAYITMINTKNTVTVMLPTAEVSESGITVVYEELVLQAVNSGMVPAWLQYNYLSNVTREDLCTYVGFYINTATGTTLDALRTNVGANYADFSYTDVDDSAYYIRSVASLGLISGYSDGSFKPSETLSNEEFAVMLEKLVKLLGTCSVKVTPDIANAGISSTNYNSVYNVVSYDIMSNETNFAANTTREFVIYSLMKAHLAVK